jgi:hypothetical protein
VYADLFTVWYLARHATSAINRRPHATFLRSTETDVEVLVQKQAQIAGILEIFIRNVGSMFMDVNSECAHQVRPPLSAHEGPRPMHPTRFLGFGKNRIAGRDGVCQCGTACRRTSHPPVNSERRRGRRWTQKSGEIGRQACDRRGDPVRQLRLISMHWRVPAV